MPPIPGLNRASGSESEGYRLLVGPFLHPEDERAATTVLTARRRESGEGDGERRERRPRRRRTRTSEDSSDSE